MANPSDLHDWAGSALAGAERALELGNDVAAGDLLDVARDALERARRVIDRQELGRLRSRLHDLLQMEAHGAGSLTACCQVGTVTQ